jgi:hypothetical protein
MKLFRPTKQGSLDWKLEYRIYLCFPMENSIEMIYYLNASGYLGRWSTNMRDSNGEIDHEILQTI